MLWKGLTLGAMLLAAAPAGAVALSRSEGPLPGENCKPQVWPPVARTIVPVEAGTLSALAKVGYFEARGDRDAFCGMVAVMFTVVNRLDQPAKFGRSIRQIATKQDQYAKLRFVPPDDPSWMQAVLAASLVLSGTLADPTGGSTYFFRADMKPWPRWARDLHQSARIGSHVFLSEAD